MRKPDLIDSLGVYVMRNGDLCQVGHIHNWLASALHNNLYKSYRVTDGASMDSLGTHLDIVGKCRRMRRARIHEIQTAMSQNVAKIIELGAPCMNWKHLSNETDSLMKHIQSLNTIESQEIEVEE